MHPESKFRFHINPANSVEFEGRMKHFKIQRYLDYLSYLDDKIGFTYYCSLLVES